MDIHTTSSHADHSRTEKTFCGVPSTADLLQEDSKWITNLQSRGYVDASDNRLTQEGKTLLFGRLSFRIDWVSQDPDGGIRPHPDFEVAQSVVDNRTIGESKQLQANDLCQRIALLSCFTVNQKIRAGEGPYKIALEVAQTELNQAYEEWCDHIHDEGRATRDPTWRNKDKPVTLTVAMAANKLSSLVMDPDEDVQQGQTPKQSFTDLTEYWNPTIATGPVGITSSASNKHSSVPVGSHQYDHSLPSKGPQSTVTRQPAGSGSAGLLGGMIAPSGDGDLVGSKQNRFPDANHNKNGRNSGADDLRSRIKKSITRMTE